MAYTINLTDGTIFATIADGTINTGSSMTLVGKNYAGYGEFLDENFIHLLENSSNSTAPGAPLTGQLWWDKANGLMKVYNGTAWKTISASTASGSAPSSNVTGDLWFDTINQQLKVYNGSQYILVGPASGQGQGTSGAIVTTIKDISNADHVIVQLYVNSTIVAIVSKDQFFQPLVAITGFTSGIYPGIQLNTNISNVAFTGDASNALKLGGILASAFLQTTGAQSMTGTLAINNDNGMTVGADADAKISVSGAGVVNIANQTNGQNMVFTVNVGGVPTTAMTIYGANGAIAGTQINANYADVAERFAADDLLTPGTVVELGGAAEITKSLEELSDRVFGVVSTKAAYLMNSNAGTDETHPAVAMTGRVPVRTLGTVRKGDRLVAAGNGLARAALPGEATPFNVIGRALEHKSDVAEGMVEAIVTIK